MEPDPGFLLILVLSMLPAFYVSIFLHELGHAACAYLAGLQATSFGLGTSRPFFVASVGGVRVFLCFRRPLQGISFWINPQLFPSCRQQVFALSGGILAHFLLTAAAASLLWLWPAWAVAWWAFGGINLIMGVTNLIPLRVRLGPQTLRNDGALILAVLRFGSASSGSAQVLSTLQAFRELWRATGDWNVLYAQLLSAAGCWVGLDDAGRAGELLAEARALPFEPSPPWQAYGLLSEAQVALGRDDLAGAELALAGAEGRFRSLDHDAGQFLTRLTRVALLQGRNRVGEALEVLESLAPHRLVRSREALRSLLLAQRIECRCGIPKDDLESLLAEYVARPASRRSASTDRAVFRLAARRRRERGDAKGAGRAYAQALAAAETLDAGLYGADQERFRIAQAPLLAEARECLRELRREEEAARLDAFFPTPKERARKTREAHLRRDAWLLRRGMALLLFNTAVVALLAATAGILAAARPDADGWRPLLAIHENLGPLADALLILLIFFSLFAGAAGLTLAALGRLSKGFAGLAGAWCFSLAVVPWAIWAVALVTTFCLWMSGGLDP